MDLNRRHLIGASVTGAAGALAMAPDAAHAAPLTSALGRDATQYGVRPGSPEDQTRVLQRAIDEAARALTKKEQEPDAGADEAPDAATPMRPAPRRSTSWWP